MSAALSATPVGTSVVEAFLDEDLRSSATKRPTARPATPKIIPFMTNPFVLFEHHR
jgi:hypothetical protein